MQMQRWNLSLSLSVSSVCFPNDYLVCIFFSHHHQLSLRMSSSVGVIATCPICLEESTEVVALPCGHVLCKTDYEKLGGRVKSMQTNNEEEGEDDSTTKMLIHIRKAGQHAVNGTYRRHHHDKNRYTSMGRYDGKDVEYYIELRNVSGEKYWYLSAVDHCNPNDAPTDFYKAKVNLRFGYPCHVVWESATLYGTFPAPKVSMSRLDM